jgi:hypothetical protein
MLVLPSSTSGMPTRRVAITGIPKDNASKSTKGQQSCQREDTVGTSNWPKDFSNANLHRPQQPIYNLTVSIYFKAADVLTRTDQVSYRNLINYRLEHNFVNHLFDPFNWYIVNGKSGIISILFAQIIKVT